jgi:hypothetical protein
MRKFVYCFLLLAAAGCKEKFDLPTDSPETGYLVIEGVISPGPDSTQITLSRTNKTNSSTRQMEKGARVQVEGEDNSVQLLAESFDGIYTSVVNINAATQYRLRVKTVAGKEYLSSYVPVKITPPIDSISWQRDNGGVRLHFNTHDPQNDTRYYRWDYKETWEFHSAFRSFLKYGDGTNTIGFKDSVRFLYDSTVYKCWRSASSNNIILGSSAKLSSDVISKEPFLFIPGADRRLSVLYSIYVRQYGLTKEAYEFLEKMKKNTEGTGSIFDPQPSQLNGNITCVTNPGEVVIGFVSICSVEDKRLFIRNSEVPGWNYRTNCFEARVRNNPDSIDVVRGAGLVPTDALETFNNFIVYFGVSERDCVECTRTGTNVRPSFWP